MKAAPFETSNFDLAVIKSGAGCPVRYTGPHQGVFRFESMKFLALRASRENSGGDGEGDVADAALRRFFALH